MLTYLYLKRKRNNNPKNKYKFSINLQQKTNLVDCKIIFKILMVKYRYHKLRLLDYKFNKADSVIFNTSLVCYNLYVGNVLYLRKKKKSYNRYKFS